MTTCCEKCWVSNPAYSPKLGFCGNPSCPNCHTTGHQNEAEWEKEARRLISICHVSLESDEMEQSRDEMLDFIRQNFISRAQLPEIEARIYRSVLDGDAALHYEKGKQDGRAEVRAQVAEVVGKLIEENTRMRNCYIEKSPVWREYETARFNLEAVRAKLLSNPN